MSIIRHTVIVIGLLFLVLMGISNCSKANASVYSDPQKYLDVTVKIETADGMGSGVVIGDNLVLTAHHVVGDNPDVSITFSDGSKVIGTVVMNDAGHDFSMVSVKVPVKTYSVVVSCTPLKLGEPIDVLGYPLDLGLVYSPGVVSSVDTAKNPQTNYQVAVSALITHGNSGGPVFNAAGELVGIVDSMVAAKEGPSISLIIPVTDIIPQCTSK